MKRLALLCLLVLGGCAYPNITLQAEPRPATQPEQVAVLTALPPAPFTRLGLVYAWSPIPVDSNAGYDYAVQRLRERAGTIGASAIVVPDRAKIGWPRIRSQWMWPDARRDRDDEDSRPSELRGIAVYIPAYTAPHHAGEEGASFQ